MKWKYPFRNVCHVVDDIHPGLLRERRLTRHIKKPGNSYIDRQIYRRWLYRLSADATREDFVARVTCALSANSFRTRYLLLPSLVWERDKRVPLHQFEVEIHQQSRRAESTAISSLNYTFYFSMKISYKYFSSRHVRLRIRIKLIYWNSIWRIQYEQTNN